VLTLIKGRGGIADRLVRQAARSSYGVQDLLSRLIRELDICMGTVAVSERVETIVSHALVVIQPISRTFCGVSDTYKQLSRRLSSDLEAKQLRVALSRAEEILIPLWPEAAYSTSLLQKRMREHHPLWTAVYGNPMGRGLVQRWSIH
jgi:hypothetical protein